MPEVHLFRSIDLGALDVDALFNASPNSYLLLSGKLEIVGCNEAYLLAVGRSSREQIVGRYLFDAFPSDPASPSYKLLKQSLDRVLETHAVDHIALIPYDVAEPGEPAKMRYWSATHTPIFDSSGAFRHILQHTVDVTELQRLRKTDERNIDAAGVLARAASVQAENSALSTEIGLVKALFRQAPGFTAVLTGSRHVFQLANAAYEQLVGRDDLVGKSVAEALPEVVDQGFVALLDQVYRTGEPFIGRAVPVQLKAGEGPTSQRVLDFIYQPIRGSDGTPVGVFVQGHDITQQKRYEDQLINQTEVLRLAQEAGGFGTFEWDLASGQLLASSEFRRLYGFADDDAPIPVSVFRDRVHPDDVAKLATHPGQSLEAALQPTEYRILRADGAERWVARQGTVMRDVAGQPSRVVGAVHDITQRKQVEMQLQAMAMESTHRIKNLLSIIQAIVSQTLRRARDIPEATSKLSSRISALGSAQTALVAGHDQSSSLAEVVQQFVELHSDHEERIAVNGPDMPIDQRTALGLALVLHELGTNAAKYGALSNDDGRVSIDWTLAPDGEAADLSWRETDGPPVAPPTRHGFGSSLIERMLPIVPGSVAQITYLPEGVQFSARLKLDGSPSGPSGQGS